MLDFWNYFEKMEGNPPWNNFIKVGGIPTTYSKQRNDIDQTGCPLSIGTVRFGLVHVHWICLGTVFCFELFVGKTDAGITEKFGIWYSNLSYSTEILFSIMDTTSWISQDRITHIRTESYTLSPRPTDHCFSLRTKNSNSFPQSHKIMCDAATLQKKTSSVTNKTLTFQLSTGATTCKLAKHYINRIASNKVSLESSPCIVRRG
jgi:hypothetical protein